MKRTTLLLSGSAVFAGALTALVFSAPNVSALEGEAICSSPPSVSAPSEEVAPTIISPPPVCSDGDGDGVATTIENGAPAHSDETGSTEPGDHNGDGTQDSRQSQVASLPNPNDQEKPGSYVTLEVLPSDDEESSHWKIKQFGPTPDDVVDPAAVPADTSFPVGLFDIKLENRSLEALLAIQDALKCDTIHNPFLKAKCLNLKAEVAEKITDESQATVRLLFDRVLDHSDWQVQQYVDGAFQNYTAVVQDEIVGFLRTTITWTLTDGGDGDLDGVINANGKISDPIGPSVTKAVSITSPAASAATITTAASVKTALAHTGTNNLLVGAIAVLLLAASLYVARAKQNV